MQPRTVNSILQGSYAPGLQSNNHRGPSQQSQLPSMASATPSFLQQRGQSSFGFPGGLQSTQQQSTPHPQQTNGGSNSLPPHIAQTPSLGNAPSVSSASDVGLDPNDFPALGSTTANNSNSTTTVGGSATTSYASQAGTGVPLGSAGGGTGSGTIGGGAAGGTRDFTPDDFPALGGQTHAPSSSQDNQPHPPGLNGFQHTDNTQQQRQTLLGALGGLQTTPGMLNLGQSRNVHPGFQQGQTETEKHQQRVSFALSLYGMVHALSECDFARFPPLAFFPYLICIASKTLTKRWSQNNYALKLNQATHAAWNSPNANPSAQTQGAGSGVSLSLGTGAFSNPPPAPSGQPQQQNGTHSQTTSTTHLTAPPGVPPPSNAYVPQPGAISSTPSTPPPYPSNGAPGDSQSISNPPPNTNLSAALLNPTSNSIPPHSQQHPQTPAQQVLVSAADRWGLLGLLAMLKNVGTDLDSGLSGIGMDLGTMGLDMAYSG